MNYDVNKEFIKYLLVALVLVGYSLVGLQRSMRVRAREFPQAELEVCQGVARACDEGGGPGDGRAGGVKPRLLGVT